MSQREIHSVSPIRSPTRPSKHPKKPATCLVCDAPASKEIVFLIQSQDVLVIERYCDSCANVIESAGKQS